MKHTHRHFSVFILFAVGSLLLTLGLLGGCGGDAGAPGGGTPPPDHNGNGEDPPDEHPNPPGNDGSCDLPRGGKCEGTVLHSCDENGQERSVDCASTFHDGTCKRAALTSSCRVIQNGVCGVIVDGHLSYARCAGDKAGCVANRIGGTFLCRNNVGSCTTSLIGECLPGNRYYVSGCLSGQPRGYDCLAMGGTCAGRACRGLPEGAQCQTDLLQTQHYLVCADGLKCVGPTDTSTIGSCQPK